METLLDREGSNGFRSLEVKRVMMRIDEELREGDAKEELRISMRERERICGDGVRVSRNKKGWSSSQKLVGGRKRAFSISFFPSFLEIASLVSRA